MNHFIAARLAPLATLACLLALVAPAFASVEVVYRDAMRARDLEQWTLAAALFDLALRERGTEGGRRVLLYGTRWEDYTPHLHLGQALFELGFYPEAFAEWQESLAQTDWQRRERKTLDHRYLPEFAASCGQRLRVARQRIETSRAALPRLRERLAGSAPPPDEAATRLELEDRLDATVQWIDESAGLLPAGGGNGPCAVEAPTDEVAKVAAALDAARRIEHVEKLGEDAHDALLEVEHRLDAWQDLADRDEARRALDELDRRLEALESSPGPAHRGGAAPRPRVRTAALAPAAEVGLGDGSAGAFEDYLVGLGYARAGRCGEAVEHVERAVAALGESFDLPAAWAPDCGTASSSWHDKRCYRPHAALAVAHAACPGTDARARARRELELALAAGELTPAWKEEIERDIARRATVEPYRGSSALLVGVSSYQGGWPPLVKVGQDLEALAAALRERDVEVPPPLLDGSKAQIEEAIEEAIRTSAARSAQRFVFYFGGHGDTYRTRQGVPLGYIVPSGAPAPPTDPAAVHGFLANEVIHLDRFFAWARQLEVEHALFVFDSCFSGAVRSFAEEGRADRRFDPEVMRRPVRMFLAAGRENQRVSATSRFREELVRSIAGCADADHNGYVAASELGDYLFEVFRDQETQTPWWGELEDPLLTGGDVLFEVRGTPTTCPDARWERDSTDLELWEKVNELFARTLDPSVLELYEPARPGFFRPALELKRLLVAQGRQTAALLPAGR